MGEELFRVRLFYAAQLYPALFFPSCSPGVDEQLKMVKMNRGNERFVNDERVNGFSHGLPWGGCGTLLSFMLVFVCGLVFVFAG